MSAMSAKTVRPALRRTLALACAAAALPLSSLALGAEAHAVGTSSVGGPITRTEVLARAQSWIDAGVMYSQSNYRTDSNGTYRQDCSGYVSMAWHINTAGTNYGFTTNGAGGFETQLGSLDDLKPGDALNNINSHMVLFVRWVDSSHTAAVIDEEAHSGIPARTRTMSRSEITGGGFKPFRYNKIDDSAGSTSYPNPASLPTGTLVKSPTNPTVKLLVSGAGIPVTGSDVASDGYDLSKVVVVDEAGFNALPAAPPAGTVVHDQAGGPDRFVIVGGAALQISASEWTADGYNQRPDMGVPTAWLNTVKQADLPSGTVVHDQAGGPARYVVVGGAALQISASEWTADGYNQRPDMGVPGGWLNAAAQRSVATGLLVQGQGGNDPTIYVMVAGSALPINGTEWTADGYETQTLMGVPEAWLAGAAAKPLKNGTVVHDAAGTNPTISVMVGGKAVPLTNADFTGLGYDKKPLLGVPSTWLGWAVNIAAPSNGTMLLSPDNPTVWQVVNGGSKRAMAGSEFGPGKLSFDDVVSVPTSLTASLPTVAQ